MDVDTKGQLPEKFYTVDKTHIGDWLTDDWIQLWQYFRGSRGMQRCARTSENDSKMSL